MPQPLRDDEAFELVGDERDGDYERPERRFPAVMLSLALMVVFAGGLWFAYHLGARHSGVGASAGGIPLIRADRSPDKVRPEQPGGMKVPDQNASIFNEKPGIPKVERLLPPPEKPMPRPVAPPAPAAAAAQRPAAVPHAVPQQAAMPPAPETSEAAPEQRRARAAQSSDGEEPTADAGPAGKIKVRLGSLRSPDAAREEWQRLKHDNPDLLGRLTAVAVRTDLGDKGIYYRIEAGPLRDTAAAEKLCGELKQRNFGCLLAR